MIDFERLRLGMVNSQIRTSDVTEPRLIAALLEIPRERFVPAGREDFAYLDDDLPVGEAASGRPPRYLMEPMVLAKLIQALELSPSDRVLDVGCATGYSAALLGKIAGQVIALEEEMELAAHARKTLAELGLANVEIVTAPLPQGVAERGPYDAILVNGSVEQVPETLFGQLREGGRLGAVIRSGPMGRATLHLRVGGTISRRALFDAAVPPLPGFEEQRGFVF